MKSINIGDKIIITKRCDLSWSSAANGKRPNENKIIYPLYGKVTNLVTTDYTAICLKTVYGNLGFSLEDIIWIKHFIYDWY